ncbi:hypothetical protein V5O48_017250 [Marasmius crinis-equi]|uniref:FAD/NAD(P)-binding domain-containing protein n=1 Tax=Marasmius crinis-equi TaxID=585013 RepID=A0ABR3EPI9_9AGAR
MSSNKKTSVVIVGGGIAGTAIARSLSGSLDASKNEIILISPHPYLVLLPATLRMVVSDADKLEETALVPLDRLFLKDNGTFVQGEVARIDEPEREVELTNGEKVSFDILVLATGTKWGGPIALPNDSSQVQGFIEERRREFKEAKDILLVGGGSVGIELAGELRDLSTDKKITIVHRDRMLLNSTYPDKMRNAMQEQLEKRNISLILNDSVNVSTPGPFEGTITTSGGKTLNPDFVVYTWGGRPNTDLIRASLGEGVLTETGLVKVKPTLQLEGRSNVFAVGDIVNWSEQKTAMKALAHVAVVVKNIIDLLAGKPTMAVYKGSMEAIAVTNGKEQGVTYLPFLWGLVLKSWLTAMLKSRSLGIPTGRRSIGY